MPKLLQNKKCFFAAFVIFCMLVATQIFASCSQNESGSPDPNIKNTDSQKTPDDAAAPEDGTGGREAEYEFPEADYGGADFSVISSATKAWVVTNYSDIVVEGDIGEVLNDAVYKRNLQIEEMFGISLKQTEIVPDDVIKRVRTLITSGDDTYDAMFVCHCWNGAIGTIAIEGGLYELSGLAGLQIDKPWWGQNINEQLKIGASNSLYFAFSDIVIHSMQSAMILMFNEKMVQDLGLDLPYELVRGGKWTLDEYQKYIKAGTNLNGDDSWKWNPSGNSVYGHSSYHMGATAMLIGTDVVIIDFDNANLPYFAADNEHFYDAVQKLADILSLDGQYYYEDTWGTHRSEVFLSERALFLDGHLGTAASLREMENPFGILPMPKYDESQENYRTHIHSGTVLAVIPVTNADPEKAAAILDGLAYLSYRDVRPVYYEVALPNKHLRNEDSIDMIELILDNRTIHIGYVYDWTTSFLNNSMRTAIQKSNPDAASMIEKSKSSIESNIQKTMDFFGIGG